MMNLPEKNTAREDEQNSSSNIIWNFDTGRFISSEENASILIRYSWILVFTTAVLTFFGLTMIYSASYGSEAMRYFKSQIFWIIFGICGGITLYYIGYKKLINWSPYMIFGVLILLGIAFCSKEVNGAHRWIFIKLPGFSMSIQPSEFTKIIMSLYVAGYCSLNFRSLSQFFTRNGVWKIFAVSGIVLGSILAGKDLGTTVLVAIMIGMMLFAAGMPIRFIVLPLAIIVIAGALYIYFFDAMRMSRVVTFLNPEKYQKDGGYQLWTSLMALGSGGWTGMGFLGSRFKAKYLPEQHTDFILSVVGEELGFLTLLLVITGYVFFVFSALKISLNANNKTGMLLGFGITTFIACQALINMLVIAGLAPTKGMPAPFISYGGSNLVVCLSSVGVLLSIAANSINEDYNLYVTDKFHSIANRIFRHKK